MVHQLTLQRRDLQTANGIPTTTVLRTVADVVLRADRYSAVSVLDSALNLRRLVPEELPAILPLIHGRRGAEAARRYLSLVDERAQSPLETRVRLRCVDGRVPPDYLQHVIRADDGYILGVADLAWRQRVVAEADGAGPHSTPQALYEDPAATESSRERRLAGPALHLERHDAAGLRAIRCPRGPSCRVIKGLASRFGPKADADPLINPAK